MSFGHHGSILFTRYVYADARPGNPFRTIDNLYGEMKNIKKQAP